MNTNKGYNFANTFLLKKEKDSWAQIGTSALKYSL